MRPLRIAGVLVICILATLSPGAFGQAPAPGKGDARPASPVKGKPAPSLPYKITSKKFEEKAVNITISYPVIYGMKDPALQKRVNDLIHGAVVKAPVADYRKYLRECKADKSANWRFENWTLEIDSSTRLASPGLLSLAFVGSVYTGGAHPCPIMKSLLVDMRKGKAMGIRSLFGKDAMPLEFLSKRCISELSKEKNGDEEWIARGAGPKDENYQVFSLSREGLTIVFPPYQVDCYAAGPKEVRIPWKDMKDVLHPSFPLQEVSR